MRPRRFALFFAASCAISLASVAHAEDVRLHVTLLDGTELQGELVENVPGDHLTIKLATGEVRTMPWSSIASTDDASPDPPAPAKPPPAPLPKPSPFGSTLYGGVDARADHVVVWPQPDASPSPFDGNHLYFGLASGIGTPTGYGGVVAAWDPVPWFELEGGVGTGGKFGTGYGGMARVEIPLMSTWRLGLGLGYSNNVLSASARAPGGEYANAPSTAHWLNLEFFEMDFATGKTGFLRVSGGYAFMLNADDYQSMCPTTSYGYGAPCEPPSLWPTSPRSYASDTHPPFVPYVGIEYVWRLL